MNLALKKALTKKNICVGFRTTRILLLNKDALEGKMGASTIFQHSQVGRETFEEDEVFSEAFEEANEIEVEEILYEGIPSSPKHYTHSYVSIEDECSYPFHDSFIAEHVLSQPCSQFLRLPKIQIPISCQ